MEFPYVGTVVCVGFEFAPRGWLPCDGSLLPIAGNGSLYSVLGVAYGGDGVQTFALPDLRGRAPVHYVTAGELGQVGGTEAVMLTEGEMAAHGHVVEASTLGATTPTIQGGVLAAGAARGIAVYAAPGTVGELEEHMLSPTGGDGAHENRQPFIAMNYYIAQDGVYPGKYTDQGDPWYGEVRAFAFGTMPATWLPCDGRLLQIQQYQALYSLLGTQFGGNGTTTFGLPDLRGRLGLGAGQGPGLSVYTTGEKGGAEQVALSVGTMPGHFHQVDGTSGAPTTMDPAGNMIALEASMMATGVYDAVLDASALGNTGTGAGHENMMPFLALQFGICVDGTFPSRA